MNGIVITYDYAGDEAEWETVVGTFVAALNTDAELGGRFRYVVSKSKSSSRRTHFGSWDSKAVLDLMQSRDYFKVFSTRLKSMAGDSLSPDAMQIVCQTANATA